jgi:hypothetical protein
MRRNLPPRSDTATWLRLLRDPVEVVLVGGADHQHVDVVRYRSGLVARGPRPVNERAVHPGYPGQRVGEHRKGPVGHGEQVGQGAAERRVGGGSEQADVTEATVGEQAGVDEPGRRRFLVSLARAAARWARPMATTTEMEPVPSSSSAASDSSPAWWANSGGMVQLVEQ